MVWGWNFSLCCFCTYAQLSCFVSLIRGWWLLWFVFVSFCCHSQYLASFGLTLSVLSWIQRSHMRQSLFVYILHRLSVTFTCLCLVWALLDSPEQHEAEFAYVRSLSFVCHVHLFCVLSVCSWDSGVAIGWVLVWWSFLFFWKPLTLFRFRVPFFGGCFVLAVYWGFAAFSFCSFPLN